MKMSKVLKELSDSDDPVDRRMARALIAVQDSRTSRGLPRHMGREPGDILKHGAIYVIEKRIRKNSDGFNDVGPEHSYEAIVLDYPDRFEPDVVELARQRLGTEREKFAPTPDYGAPYTHCFEARTEGGRKVYVSHRRERNPQLRRAAIEIHGTDCMVCGFNFETAYGALGKGFIEVHHVTPLSDAGLTRTDPNIDLVVLCANCH